jgi:hypothetical protein
MADDQAALLPGTYRMPDQPEGQNPYDDWRRGTPKPSPLGTPGLEDLEAKANADTAKERGELAGPMGQLRRAEAQRPQTPNLQKIQGSPPDAKDFQKNSLEFASAMAVIGAISSRFTRQPGGAALGAFGAALNGWQTGNLVAYENAAKEWDQKTKETIANNRIVLENYKIALQNNQHNIDEQMSAIQLIAVKYHDDIMYQAAASKNFTMVAQIYEKGVKQTGLLEKSADWFNNVRKTDNAAQALTAERLASGQIDPNGVNPQTGQPWTEAQKLHFKHIQERASAGDFAEGKVHPAKEGSKEWMIQKRNAELRADGKPELTAEEAKRLTSAQPRSGPAMALQKQMEKDPNTDPTKFMAAYNAAQTRARVLAQRGTNIDISTTEAQTFARRALETSAQVPRGEWVKINQLKQAAQRAGSSPILGKFEVDNASLITAYSQTMSRTGVNTVEAQKRATDLLSTADGHEAYKARVGELLYEMDAVKQAVRDVKDEDDGGSTPQAGGASGGWGKAEVIK